GAAAIQLDGTVIFTPAAGFSGAGSFTYTINDGRGGSASGSVTGNVNAPTRVAQAFSDGTGARSALITTTGPTVLVALVASDGPPPGDGANNKFLTVSRCARRTVRRRARGRTTSSSPCRVAAWCGRVCSARPDRAACPRSGPPTR